MKINGSKPTDGLGSRFPLPFDEGWPSGPGTWREWKVLSEAYRSENGDRMQCEPYRTVLIDGLGGPGKPSLYYTLGSAPCHAVMQIANLLELDLNLIHVNLREKEQLKSDFVKLNPQHTVPTLVDGHFVICESHTIGIYLAEKYGKNNFLYPNDIQTRALILQRLFFDATVLYQRFADAYYPLIRDNTGLPIDEEKLEKLREAFQFLNTILEESKFVAGSHLTIADISLISSIDIIQSVDFDISDCPNVVRWLVETKSMLKDYDETINKGVETFRKYYLQKKDEIQQENGE